VGAGDEFYSLSGHYSAYVTPNEDLAEVALVFHGLAMNGGFLDAFGAMPFPLNEVVEAFELLKLDAAADLIRAGINAVSGTGTAGPTERQRWVDDLADDAADRLESLGGQYTALVTDALLTDRIGKYAAASDREAPLPGTVPALLNAYVDTLTERMKFRQAGKTAKANRLVERNHEIYKQLRESEEGKAGIWSLRLHAERAVSQTAIVHSLAWQPVEAVELLEQIEAADGPGAFEAKWTLRSWRDGRLKLDW
jgi:hypothetical protein